MKKVLLFISFFSLLSFLLISQEVTYANRSTKQQNFILDYSKKHQLSGKPFTSYEEIDERVKALSEGWQQLIKSNDPVLNRFDGYPLYMISLSAGNEGWSTEYIFIKYMVPNLIEDIQYIMKDPLSPSIYLWNIPTYSSAIGLSLNMNMDSALWNKYYEALYSLPESIDSVLNQKKFADNFETTITTIKNILIRNEKHFELLNAIYNEKLDSGFYLLREVFSERMIDQKSLIRPAQLLCDKFNASNLKEKAFATLDLLSQFTIEPELPRDSLKSWYLNLDKKTGEVRYESISKKPAEPILMRSANQHKLDGVYLNLTTGNQFDLSKIENRYVLIDFWATWCSPCIIEIPELNKFHSLYESDENVVFISVICDAVTRMKEMKMNDIINFIKQNNIKYAVLYDTDDKSLSAQFKVNGWPSKFLLDKDGYILERTVGRRVVDLEAVKEFLRCLKRVL